MISKALAEIVLGRSNGFITLTKKFDEFYWVFYAGMGTSDYYEVTTFDAGYITCAIEKGLLKVTEEEITIPNIYSGKKIIASGA